jgi:diguanylate cyclase (GGDEF)-like protein
MANMGALRIRISQAVERAREGGPKPALIAVDLDNFKSVNDRYSHTVGDQVIVAVSRALADTLDAGALVTRHLGDQFYVLCACPSDEEFVRLQSRLHEAVSHARTRLCADLIATATITGVPWMWGESPESFFDHAEGALNDERSYRRLSAYRRVLA